MHIHAIDDVPTFSPEDTDYWNFTHRDYKKLKEIHYDVLSAALNLNSNEKNIFKYLV